MAKQIFFDDVKVGDAMPVYTSAPITRTHIVRYAGASGDFNPLHHDDTFTTMIGMPRIISHGMLIMGITGEAVTQWIPNKCLRKFSVRFAGMTEPVDLHDFDNTKARATLTVTGKVAEKYEEAGEKRIKCDLQVADAAGGVKITGSFIAALPAK